MSGILSVVGTPIGNLEDLSPRAARVLADADIIACEDTRVTRKLLTRAPTHARLVAYHARNETVRTPELVRAVASGSRVALTTDAGMPGLSDPGGKLVAACAAAGVRIEVIPGPSAAAAALVVSGLPTARFVFEGFLPRTRAGRRRRLEALAAEERTIVLFEAPHRLVESLTDMAEVLGPRRAAVARELTKVHEEVIRETLPELVARFTDTPPRGEITVVIEGTTPAAPLVDEDELARAVADEVARGSTKRDAISLVARGRGISKRIVYQAAVGAVDGEVEGDGDVEGDGEGGAGEGPGG
jgi:16S rRNA (cytidine1402-2'-O)-methyltransferase